MVYSSVPKTVRQIFHLAASSELLLVRLLTFLIFLYGVYQIVLRLFH
jgi:hypothetical protein